MIGIILSICVSFLKACGDLAGKIFTQQGSTGSIDEYSLAYGGRIASFLVLLPLAFFIPLKSLSGYHICILTFSAILNSLATVTTLKAVKYGELSLVGPLSAFSIPFLLLSSYLILGELPNIYGLLGVICIFIGSYFLGVSDKTRGFLGPLRAIWKDIGARYMLLTAAIWSLTIPLDKLGIQEFGVLVWMLYLSFAIALVMTIYSSIFRKVSFHELQKPQALKKVFLMTILGGAMLLLQMLALKLTLAIYVVSIKRASGVFNVLFGFYFFKEKNIGWKLFAASLMILGVVCIPLLGNI